MTELEQLAPDSDAAPPRVVRSHLQNQLLDPRIETWPTWTTPVAERRPSSPYQLAMPAEDGLRLDEHPD
jgi:hypothetical protein